MSDSTPNTSSGIDDDEEAFDRLLNYIETDLGFGTSHYNRPYLKRRISSRMRRCGADTYDDYYDVVADDETEQRHLLDSFSINVTEFFRNPQVWEGIRILLKRLLEVRDGELRIWSAGCADGREPYSVALLALATPEIDSSRIRITGTDINPAAITAAQSGTYQETSLGNLREQLSFLDGYEAYINVDEDAEVFSVAEEVHELVEFRQHDLLSDPPLRNIDVVLCRNLLIYIDRESEFETLSNISESLKQGGFLVVGKTETIRSPDELGFRDVDTARRVYQYYGGD